MGLLATHHVLLYRTDPMTYQSSPDLLSAIQDTYSDFTWQESVCAYFDLIGEPDEDTVFDAFCTTRGGLRCLDEIRRTTNALLNATFYVASFATCKAAGHALGDFDFDAELPALYVPEHHLPKLCLLYAIEASLAMTPWVKVEHGTVSYDPAGHIHDTLVLKRDLMLSGPVSWRFSPEDLPYLYRPMATIAHWFSQQTEPVRFKACELDALAGGYLKRGQLAAS